MSAPWEMTEDQLARLSSDNRDLRLELTAEKELIIMPPAFSETGWQELELARQVGNWAKQGRHRPRIRPFRRFYSAQWGSASA